MDVRIKLIYRVLYPAVQALNVMGNIFGQIVPAKVKLGRLSDLVSEAEMYLNRSPEKK